VSVTALIMIILGYLVATFGLGSLLGRIIKGRDTEQ
jgi:hypothetical protein